MVLLYSDGPTDARRPDGELFAVEPLAEFIKRQAATDYRPRNGPRAARRDHQRRRRLRTDVPRPSDARCNTWQVPRLGSPLVLPEAQLAMADAQGRRGGA